MTDWTRVPVLIGAGQITNREEDPLLAPDPFELMTSAARRAAVSAAGEAGAGELLGALSHCFMVHSLSLRHGTPARELAGRLGASQADARTSGMGGNVPQWLVDRAAELVASGVRPVVAVVGAEALATRRRAKRAGVRLPWPGDGGWPETWPPLEPDLGVHPVERAAGLEQATAMYALIETVVDHDTGRDPATRRAALGRLMGRLNAVAAANPYAWFPTRRSAEELTTVTPDNRMIFHPYPKYLNAVMDVDMAAAVILTDAHTARQRGLGPDQVVYVRGWADATDVWYLSERPRPARSPALAAAAASALEMAGLSVSDMAAFDLYSCFASSVEAAMGALGLEPDDPRPLTLTGGLPYHGGPGSNYVTHALADTFEWLRAGHGEHALVHGNGYYLTKHAVGVYSRQAPADVPAPDGTLQARVDEGAETVPLCPSLPGRATVVGYTVPYDRAGNALAGVVMAEAGGRRTVALADEELTPALVDGDAVGTSVALEAVDGGPDRARPA
jgi:acetyl-CoA C-acetyltransferase